MAKAAVKKTSSGKTRKVKGQRAISKPKRHLAKPAKPVQTAKSAKPVKAAKSAKPVKAAKAAKPAKPVKTAKPAKPVKAVKAAKPLKVAKVVKSVKAVVMAKRGRKPGKAKPTEQPVVHTTPDLLQKPVASDLKPRKNQAGLTMKQLEHFRDLLLARRRELVGDMSSMAGEALRTSGTSNLSNLPIHMADMGTDNYEQEFTLGLMEKDRNLLRDINSALAKIQSGTYGLCEATGKPISPARLEARPWARFSIEHARSLERGGVR